MNRTPEEVWWKYVPASRQMVKGAVRDLTDNGLSLQISPHLAPWKEQFEDELRECIDKYGYGIDLRELNGSDLAASSTLLDGVVHSLGIDRGFDGTILSLGKNLPESGLIVWLHDLSTTQQKQCFDLCAKLSSLSGKDGFPRFHFIFESESTTKRKGIRLLNPGEPSRSNIRYFVYRLLMEADLGKLTEYAVTVVMEATGQDIERCGEMCLRIIDQSFVKVLDSMSGDPNNLYSMHRAQLRAVEPLIQIARLRLCEKYSARIKKILPFCDDYGTTIEEPLELELRHLWHNKSRLSLSPADDSELRRLYDARNDLSHQRILNYQTVCDLLDKYQ